MDAKPRLLDRVRDKLRALHYSYRTEQQYLFWIRRYILFHGKRHPAELGAADVEDFLTHLAVDRTVAASTQNQAMAAILFLYKKTLEIELPWLNGVIRAKPSMYLPVVLTSAEVRSLLSAMEGQYRLIGNVRYGGGLRIMEGLQLRVKDLQIDYRQIIVRSGKGDKDRVTIMPESLVESLRAHLVGVQAMHEHALRNGYAGVEIARSAVAQVSARAVRVGMAVRVPGQVAVARSAHAGLATASHIPGDCAATGQGGHSRDRADQASIVSYVPALLCHALARARLRYPHRSGTARASGREDDADLHARHAQRRQCGAEPVGSVTARCHSIPGVGTLTRAAHDLSRKRER